MRLFLFEDQRHSNFYPLTLTRPVWDLRLGFLTLAEKWALEFSDVEVQGELRSELVDVFQENISAPFGWRSNFGRRSGAETTDATVSKSGGSSPEGSSKPQLLINSRFLPTDALLVALKKWIDNPEQFTEFIHNEAGEETLVAKGIPANKGEIDFEGRRSADLEESVETVHIFLDELEWIENPWDLLDKNGEEIERDVMRMEQNARLGKVAYNEAFWNFSAGTTSGFHSNAFVDDTSAIYMHPTAVVEPGVTIQTTDGPVIIGPSALIMAGSHLKGPLAIGEGTIVKMGALLYKNSTIGPHCKVGGEVSNCIFHSFINKAHHGYAGNSIFGQWVNLGAGTTTSNLRGNYGEVRIRDWVSGKDISTGRQFLGSIMGDHVKTGINTILNTGTVVGPSSMIFGAGFAPKWIDSFSWINADTGEATEYDIEKSLVDMQRMMARRELTLSESYASLMRTLSHKRNK